jgi:hypothetical protein
VRYVAFGLQLSSPFALPGMRERSDEELPRLELEIMTRASVERDWGPADPLAVWEGTLGDGRTLLVQRGPGGEHLFTYGSRALFRLDATGEELACAPSQEGFAWQRILLSKVLAIVSMIRGYEGLHASAVESPAGAVVILAPSGTGKTALALALARGGWPLLSDDIVTLGSGPAGVLAHPGTPHLNADLQTVSAGSTRKLALVLGVLGDELWLAARASTAQPCTVCAICLLERASSLSLDVREVPANPLLIAPYMLGLPDTGGRERARFELYSELVHSAKLVRASAGDHDSPQAIADRLRGVLAAGQPDAVEVTA